MRVWWLKGRFAGLIADCPDDDVEARCEVGDCQKLSDARTVGMRPAVHGPLTPLNVVEETPATPEPGGRTRTMRKGSPYAYPSRRRDKNRAGASEKLGAASHD